MRKSLLILSILTCFSLSSCNDQEQQINSENNTQVTNLPAKVPSKRDCDELYKNLDIDALQSIVINNQEWTVHNLNVDRFQNGDLILEAQNDEEWRKAGDGGIPAWSYYNNNECNAKYGKLYNFHAVDDPRGLAPKGWHIPSDEEWIKMTRFLGDDHGHKLKSKSGWFNEGNGDDILGFNGNPSGIRYYSGEFYYYGEYAFFWTSSSIIIEHAHCRYLRGDYSDRIFAAQSRRAGGMSVRLVKDYPKDEQNKPFERIN